MRAGIGILSVLVVVAIILFAAFSGPGGGYVTTVVKKGEQGQEQARQLSGRGDSGIPVSESIGLRGNPESGALRSLLVTNVLAQGPMAMAYGLQKGDEILEVGPMRVRDNNDVELAKALVYESYGRNQALVIIRNGQQFTINPNSPLAADHPELFAKPGMTPSGNSVPPPAPDPQQQLQDQLKQIQNVPTH